MRSGDWKLQLAGGDGPKPGAKAGVKKKEPQKQEAFPRLYNLAKDVGESTNVAAQNPEVVAKLQALAEAMTSDLGLDGIGPGCRELGRVAKPQPLIGHDGTIREGFVGETKKLP